MKPEPIKVFYDLKLDAPPFETRVWLADSQSNKPAHGVQTFRADSLTELVENLARAYTNLFGVYKRDWFELKQCRAVLQSLRDESARSALIHKLTDAAR